ncbi:MAG: hypothetical protein HPY54_01125 [Chthonomonadetes bacterium]|nr:hypothetical protein [Chthonomonadetes bacterium]
MSNWLAIKREMQGSDGFVAWVRQQIIPSGEQLALEARRKVIDTRWDGVEPQKEAFRETTVDEFFCDLLDTEYEIYLQYEEKCIAEAIRLALNNAQVLEKYPHTAQMLQMALQMIENQTEESTQRLSELASLLRPFYMLFEQSLSQGRCTRAGGSPQTHFEYLLRLLGYSGEFETQTVLNGKVDFLFPNREAWKRDRQRCIIVSVKRSLRERYKQVFEELGITGGLSVYLLVTETLEEAKKDLAHSKIGKLKEQNIYLVVRDAVKQNLFPSESRVFGFSDFLLKELPLRRQIWKSLIEEH